MGFKTASKTQILYPKLDIAEDSSIESLANNIKQEHGTVDVVINNAGVNVDDDYSAKNVKITLDTNVRGTLQVSVYSLEIHFACRRFLVIAHSGPVDVRPWTAWFLGH